MTYENCIIEALAIVSAWDIPLEDFADVVIDHAKLIAGESLDPMTDPTDLMTDYPLHF
ncbi:hypothetical protein R0135_14145 [Congregibacter variabilis]|uniref:DUF4089 domain-containing protein n=1 Tax=Congregibacter variabilis TaxID=3081200 RepID=A0ABZ0I075_9GAMM|nr:hypothetical protein R0135_14145 [Congregibacter sp. IMCC43200]